jgi:predicted  nucleic acid-binding Zn-ribbon protein
MDTSSITTTASSFWKTKEGKVGKIFAFALAGAALYGLYVILPFLIVLAQSMLTLILLLVALFIVIYVIQDKQVRRMVSYLYKAAMRWLITKNPVAVIEGYISDLRKKFQFLKDKMDDLAAAIGNLERGIEDSKEAMEKNLNLAKSARKRGIPPAEILIFTNDADRAEKRIQKFTAMLSRIKTAYVLLEKREKACGIVIQDYTNRVKDIEIERSVTGKTYSAFRSAMSILSGNPDEQYMYDLAMDTIRDEISAKNGIMDRMIKESEEIMKSIDIENGAVEERGIQLLNKWESDDLQNLLTDGKAQASGQPVMVPVTVETGTQKENKYAQLLKTN